MEKHNILSNISQRSVHGPLLFLIFIKDLIKSKIKLFVDEFKLLVRRLSKEITQMDLNKLSHWENVYYFGRDFLDCCPCLYCGELKHISAAVSSSLPQMSHVYLSIKMIQPGKSFLKFDC